MKSLKTPLGLGLIFAILLAWPTLSVSAQTNFPTALSSIISQHEGYLILNNETGGLIIWQEDAQNFTVESSVEPSKDNIVRISADGEKDLQFLKTHAIIYSQSSLNHLKQMEIPFKNTLVTQFTPKQISLGNWVFFAQIPNLSPDEAVKNTFAMAEENGKLVIKEYTGSDSQIWKMLSEDGSPCKTIEPIRSEEQFKVNLVSTVYPVEDTTHLYINIKIDKEIMADSTLGFDYEKWDNEANEWVRYTSDITYNGTHYYQMDFIDIGEGLGMTDGKKMNYKIYLSHKDGVVPGPISGQYRLVVSYTSLNTVKRYLNFRITDNYAGGATVPS